MVHRLCILEVLAFTSGEFAHRLISYIYPARNKELLEALGKKKATVLGERLHESSVCMS